MGSGSHETSIIEEAKRLLGEGDLVQAYDLLSVLRQTMAAQELRDTIATHLLTEYRGRLLRFPLYPQRLSVLGDIRRYRLTANDVYVLGLYDGQTCIADAIAISPLDELATLRATAKLIDLGLVSGAAPRV